MQKGNGKLSFKPQERLLSVVPAIAELTRWYRSLCSLFAPQVLPEPVILIESCGRAVYKLGHYAPRSWRRLGGEHGEIVIVAEYLHRPVLDIAETLVHEMVHHANALAGVRDCSSHQYHNRCFKLRAESVGLVVNQMRPRGWAHTALSPRLAEVITGFGPWAEVFDLFRDGGLPFSTGCGVTTPPPRKSKLVKLVCGCAVGVWVAAGSTFDLFCRTCQTDLHPPTG